MGKKVEIELNSPEIKKLLKSEDMQKMLKTAAESRAQGWDTDVKVMGTRAISSIYTVDRDKIDEELNTHRMVGGLR